MAKASKDHLDGAFTLCLDDTGRVASVTVFQSTAFPAYDNALINDMRTWAFRPIEIHGKPAKVCTRILVEFPAPPPAK